MKDRLLLLVALVIFTGTLITGLVLFTRQEQKTQELQDEVRYLQYELRETEARCRRMTDTCIDILANRRWEEGDRK